MRRAVKGHRSQDVLENGPSSLYADAFDVDWDASEESLRNRVLVPILAESYGEMLESGIQIHRFKDAMVHAKTATVDGAWSTVGTANIDRLSLTGNYEINVEAIDEQFARALEEVFERDQSNCLELTLAEWEARDLHRRFTESILTPLRPLL